MHKFPVDASKPLNDASFDLVEGQCYRFRVPPGQTWRDWFVRCTPSGMSAPWKWAMEVMRYKLRVKTDRFGRRVEFAALTGMIGTEESVDSFLIGNGCEIVAWKSGRLFCFANDWPDQYKNNSGRLEVEIVVIN